MCKSRIRYQRYHLRKPAFERFGPNRAFSGVSVRSFLARSSVVRFSEPFEKMGKEYESTTVGLTRAITKYCNCAASQNIIHKLMWSRTHLCKQKWANNDSWNLIKIFIKEHRAKPQHKARVKTYLVTSGRHKRGLLWNAVQSLRVNTLSDYKLDIFYLRKIKSWKID